MAEEEVRMSKYALKQKRLTEESKEEKANRLLAEKEVKVDIDNDVKKSIDEIRTLKGLEATRTQKQDKLTKTLLRIEQTKINLKLLKNKIETYQRQIENIERGLGEAEAIATTLQRTIDYINEKISKF